MPPKIDRGVETSAATALDDVNVYSGRPVGVDYLHCVTSFLVLL